MSETDFAVDSVCSGIGSVADLRRVEVVDELTGDVVAHLERHRLEAQERALARVQHLLDGQAAVPAGIDQIEHLHALVVHASAVPDNDLQPYVPTAEGDHHLVLGRVRQYPAADPSTLDPDNDLQRLAANRGAFVLNNVERRWEPLADLVDDLEVALATHVRASLVVGTCPGNRLSAGNRSVIMAVGGSIEVDDPVHGSRTIPAGTTLPVDGPNRIAVPRGAVAVLLGIRMPVWQDFQALLVKKAGHVPRMRADLPYDVMAPASAYGIDEPVDPVALGQHEVSSLMDVGSLRQVRAWWRSSVIPAGRPRPELFALPPDVAEWDALHVRGRIPCGFGTFGTFEGGRWLVAAGKVIPVQDHLLDLFGRLATGSAFALDEVDTGCPAGDELCARRTVDRLLWLDLASVVPDPPAP